MIDIKSALSAISPWWLKALPYLIAVVFAIGLFISYTNNVKQEATAAADKKWQAKLDAFDEFARKRVENIYAASSHLANNADAASSRQLKEAQMAISAIQANAASGKYLTINKAGQCVFTPEYVSAFEALRNSLPRQP